MKTRWLSIVLAVAMSWLEWRGAAYKYAWETNVQELEWKHGKPSDTLFRLYSASWWPEQAVDYIRHTR